MPRPPLAHLVLLTGATLRLTRFVTSDYLGEWLIAKPARRWANDHEMGFTPDELRNPDLDSGAYAVDPELGRRSKLVKGLDCPYCVGFWLGLVLIVGSATIGKLPVAGTLWRILLGALSLNYVVGAVSSRLDH